MAKAPTPGKGPAAKAQEKEAERSAMVIRCRGNEYVLHVDDLGPQDDLLSRKQTGLPVTPFFEDEKFGSDSLLIMYWMARRKSGEDRLRYQDVINEFPSYKSISEAKFEVEAVENVPDDDGDDSHPLDSDDS